MAPPITSAMAGFQAPAMSRNAWMRSGSVMPDRIRPKPNSRPDTSGRTFWIDALISGSGQHVPHHEHGGEARRHEHQGRHQGAGREVAQATQAMAAGAARAEPRA